MWGAMLVAMAAMFVAALAVPDAFGRHGVVFGVAFLIVNVMYLTLYALAARGDRDLLAAILRNAPSALAGAALIIAAGFVHGALRPMLWLAALAVGLFGPLLGGMSGWRVQPAHFVERHGLIVIIAIGESLIAIGLGARGTGLGTGVIVAAVLGLVVVTSFWLAYFDFFPIRGQQMLADRTGAHSAPPCARCLHLPASADGGRHRPLRVRDEDDARACRRRARHDPGVGLCGGPALYLFAYVALRLRVSRTLGRGRLVAAVACALLLPVALVVPALVALALVAAVWVALHAYEIIWWREARARTRTARASLRFLSGSDNTGRGRQEGELRRSSQMLAAQRSSTTQCRDGCVGSWVMLIRAAVLEKFGAPLAVREVDLAEPRAR